MTVISTETLATLERLIHNEEFSSRAIKVASLLALSHSDAEHMLLAVLDRPNLFQPDLNSLVLCVNSICLIILERADVQLFEHLFKITSAHPQVGVLLPLFVYVLISV